MKKIEEEITYQELLLRRDILKFVFDLRCYGQIMASHDNGDFKVRHYLEHMDRFSGWNEKLGDLLDRAREIGANPNLLDEYQDDLVNRVNALREGCTLEDLERLKKISREMNSMLYICKGAKTLCGELMLIYPELIKRGLNLAKEIEPVILYLTRAFSEYDNQSDEYFFLMDNPSYGEWFLESFRAYFTKGTIPVEEHRKNLKYLLGQMMSKYEWAFEKMKLVADYYTDLEITIDKDDFTNMLELRMETTFKNSLLAYVRRKHELMPFMVDEYLDMLFDDLVNHKSEMKHSKNSPFYGRETNTVNWDEKNLSKVLKAMVIPLASISTISMEEFFKLLANKIALLPNHLEVASNISDYLKTLEPDYSSIFEEAYLEASERLPQEREQFVLTMVAIKNKQEAKSTHK